MIDISTPVDLELPVWPGMPRPAYEPLLRMSEGDDADATRLLADLHTGTHVDAPSHFCAGGATIDEVDLGAFVGTAFVADTGDSGSLGPEVLDGLGVPAETERLLLRTANGRRGLLRRPEFASDAVALTREGAEWVVARGLRLVGIDYLSIQRYDDGPETHQILLSAGVVILEGLALRDAPTGPCDLVCLPVRLVGVEAAPARAVIFPSGTIS